MQPINGSFKACPQCRTAADVNAQFCSNCGHRYRTQFSNATQVFHTPGPIQRPAVDTNKLVITLLLWLFFGGLGIHRMYLGHVPTGIAMMVLTLGGALTACILIGYIPLLVIGIWVLVDLVLILTGSLAPTDGTRII